jgi:hypothetical protein
MPPQARIASVLFPIFHDHDGGSVVSRTSDVVRRDDKKWPKSSLRSDSVGCMLVAETLL